MAAITNPRLAYPITIPVGGQEITIRYQGGSPSDETVILAPLGGTYWFQNDRTSSDLWLALETALNSNGEGVTWTVFGDYKDGFFARSGRTSIANTHATKRAIQIEFTTQTHLSAYDFGFALTTSTKTIDLAAAPDPLTGTNAEGTYQCPSVWMPQVPDTMNRLDYDVAVVSASAGTGEGDDDVYQGPETWAHKLDQVPMVLIRGQYAADPDYYEDWPVMEPGDINVALDGWIRRYQKLLGGERPTCRWTPDITTPTTRRDVLIIDPQMSASIRGWQKSENLGPDWVNLEFTLVEKQD